MSKGFDPPPSYYEPPEGKRYYCPVCGEEVGMNDDFFKNDYTGEIVGCSNCVRPAEPWEEEIE